MQEVISYVCLSSNCILFVIAKVKSSSWKLMASWFQSSGQSVWVGGLFHMVSVKSLLKVMAFVPVTMKSMCKYNSYANCEDCWTVFIILYRRCGFYISAWTKADIYHSAQRKQCVHLLLLKHVRLNMGETLKGRLSSLQKN